MSRKLSITWSRAMPLFTGILAFLLLAASIGALAGDLSAYFDRKSVYEDDKVTLIIETTGGTLGEPDLSGLAADFDLLGTSQSTNISILNGRRSESIRLLVTLVPRRTGTIDVPPIQVGNEQTSPLRLEVEEVPEAGVGAAGDDILVELELGADPGDLVVQQQVPLTVRLFTAVPLLEGDLADPWVEGALVTRIGEDRQYDLHRDGRDYQVIERRYSLSPERSGEMRIPPVRFEGSARTNRDRGSRPRGGLLDTPFFEQFFQGGPLSRDPFGMFDSGRPVSAHSRGISLQVEPRPGGYAGDHWLPAQELEIVDSWAESPPELRVGEPVMRTLTLQVKGLSGPQIPEIDVPASPGLRVYPQKTENETRSDGNTVYGISHQGVTLIPTKLGELVIPEIRVTWWDTVARQERTTTVAGWTLKVAGGSGAEAGPEPPAQPAARPVPDVQEKKPHQIPPKEAEGADSGSWFAGIDQRWFLATGAIALALLLAAAGAWGLRRLRRSRPHSTRERQAQTRAQDGLRKQGAEARKALRAACEAHDARGAAKALLDWAEATWPVNPPRNLGALGGQLRRGADEIRELERSLYAPGSGRWDGANLWQALQGGLSDTQVPDAPRDDLPEPLYPQRS